MLSTCFHQHVITVSSTLFFASHSRLVIHEKQIMFRHIFQSSGGLPSDRLSKPLLMILTTVSPLYGSSCAISLSSLSLSTF